MPRSALLLALLCPALLVGCTAPRPIARPIRPHGVAPLTEAEFDRFTAELAADINDTLRERGYAIPAVIRTPQIIIEPVAGAPTSGMAAAFGHTIASGLSDRGRGDFRFTRQDAATRIGSRLVFGPATGDSTLNRVVFVLFDSAVRAEILWRAVYYPRAGVAEALGLARDGSALRIERRRIPIELRRSETLLAGDARLQRARQTDTAQPPHASSRPTSGSTRRADRALADAPTVTGIKEPPAVAAAYLAEPPREGLGPLSPPGQIKIDHPEAGFAQHVRDFSWHYRRRTVPGRHGRIIVLDSKSWERVIVVAQRALPTADERLEVQIKLLARRRSQDVNLRVIFLDADGRQIEATPLIPHRLVHYYTKTGVFVSKRRNAVSYICLIEDE